MTPNALAEACVCEHPRALHDDEDAPHTGPCAGEGCDCSFFCTVDDADDIIDAAYYEALGDGAPWAEEAYRYRQRKYGRGE